jgi:hypothetical protein
MGLHNTGNFWCEHGICDPFSVKPSCSSIFWESGVDASRMSIDHTCSSQPQVYDIGDVYLKDRYGKPERGEWMGFDKNSSPRRWGFQQDEHGFQHTSPTHYPSWPSPCSHWSATGPRSQQTTFRAKTHQHAQRKFARLAACAAPVTPMAYAGQTGDTGQTGGQCRSGRWLQQPHNKRSREPQWLL